MRKCFSKYLLSIPILMFFVWGNADSTDQFPQHDSLVTKVDDTLYTIGNLVVDSKNREVSIQGRVNMSRGLVEYLAVTDYGKLHEAVLILDARPLHIQTSLLLLGLDFGQNLAVQGDTAMPTGDSVLIYVSWKDSTGSDITVSAHELIKDLRTDDPMPHTPWIFTGSLTVGGLFLADEEGSIIATYSDPVAILNNPLPERYDDTTYGVNEGLVPPVGTQVEVRIRMR